MFKSNHPGVFYRQGKVCRLQLLLAMLDIFILKREPFNFQFFLEIIEVRSLQCNVIESGTLPNLKYPFSVEYHS